jgi:hypothetical protein
MKRIYKQFLFSALSLTALLFVSCDKDDATGKSTLEVSQNLKLSVTTDFASPVTIIEGDNEYKFTVNIDKPQSVDVVVKVFQIAGTASGSDYAVDSQITIPAYQLSATGTLTILKDKLKESIETLTLQVGDVTTSNASLTPITVSFNIQNYTEGSLIADLSWSTSIKDVAGDLIKPTAAADFKLRITNLDFSDVESIDDSKTAFESYEMLSTLEDGDYLVVAEAVSYKDMGSQGAFDIDLSVTFNQAGIYNDEAFTFTSAVSSDEMTSCGPSGFFKLAKITKVGSSYTFSEVGTTESKKATNDASSFNGTYKVTLDEWNDYKTGTLVPVTYNSADGTSTFRVSNTKNPAIVNTDSAYLLVTINADATVTVISNEDYDYGGGNLTNVVGTGSVGFCGSSISLTLDFPGFGETGYKLNLVKN